MPETRLFKQHDVRETLSLDGEWEFYFPSEGTTIAATDYLQGDKTLLEMPGVWETNDKYINYRGQAVAKRVLTLARSGAVRLVFKGVSHTATVFLDGKQVGFHHNAYTPFAIDLPWLEEGEHELLLHISNEHGEISALHVPNDYYNYGGISRPTELQFLNTQAYVRWVHFTPVFSAGRWSAKLQALVVNLGAESKELRLDLALAGETSSVQFEAKPGETNLDAEIGFQADEVEAWSCESPKLYFLNAALLDGEEIIDDWIDRVGFRSVRVEGESILLNEQSVFLNGFNRHEDHPNYGCALPLEQMIEDLDIIQDLGCNSVRTSHYPNDERFLDLCDERGILVWEENHARGLYKNSGTAPPGIHPMEHPKFREQCRLVNEEMVNEHFNRPSIVIWGILNECDSVSDYGRSCYKEQFEQIRSLDASRPTTFASCLNDDNCQDLQDIASWNRYFGWYGMDDPAIQFDKFLANCGEKFAGMPFILSEFGAGALPGYRDPVRRGKWSEDFQVDLLDKSMEVYLNHPRVAGAFIWQFCDVRVDVKWAMGRPRTMNNKGVVDEYRRPKLAYETVKRQFGELARSREKLLST